jgi:hypothetical protein
MAPPVTDLPEPTADPLALIPRIVLALLRTLYEAEWLIHVDHGGI